MTLPDERTRAVVVARNFLRSLLDPKQTPRIPKEIRTRAYWCLRHFPWDTDLQVSSRELPEIWGPAYDEKEGQSQE